MLVGFTKFFLSLFYALATRDSVGEGIVFLGCPVVPSFVRSFVLSDIVTTISDERLEQFS